MRRHLAALTGLRFVAASMVFVLHCVQTPERWPSLDQGVSFFFVLSGFILTFIYPELPDRKAVKGFYIARLARIWPLHLLTTLVVVALFGIQSLVALTLNLLLLQSAVPIQEVYFSYNAVSWSLSTEVFFYLIFPLLIPSFKDNWYWKLSVSGLLVMVLIAGSNWFAVPSSSSNGVSIHGLLYINPVARIFEFIAGMCSCLLWRKLQDLLPDGGFRAFTLAEFMAIGFGALLVIYPFPFAHPFIGPAGVLWIVRTSALPAFCAALIVFAFGRGLVSQLLGSRLFQFLGEISFAVYLVHLQVIGLCKSWLQASTAPASANFAMAAVITMLVAAVLHFAVERPCRSLIAGLWRPGRAEV